MGDGDYKAVTHQRAVQAMGEFEDFLARHPTFDVQQVASELLYESEKAVRDEGEFWRHRVAACCAALGAIFAGRLMAKREAAEGVHDDQDGGPDGGPETRT